MTDPLHVAPGIVGFLDAPNHVRIRAIRTERWIGFGRARRVVEHLSALCEYPPSTRPPGLAIYGHSGMGKISVENSGATIHHLQFRCFNLPSSPFFLPATTAFPSGSALFNHPFTPTLPPRPPPHPDSHIRSAAGILSRTQMSGSTH